MNAPSPERQSWEPAVRRLGDKFRGQLVLPADPDYRRHRAIWNRMIDRRPALIARPTNAESARYALAFAREHDLPISVRGGGHNVAGSALVEGGVVIDFGAMKTVRVDPQTRTVDVEPGVLLGELDTATAAHGLAVPVGIATETGVAGLTLGGGIGWLMRRNGLTCDRLRAVHLLTADGDLRFVDATAEPDLFWGVRGGGGNFGIVTRFLFEAVPLGEVTAGIVVFPMETAVPVLRRYRDWAATLPSEATTILALRTVLPNSSMPAVLHGRRVLIVGLCHAGDPRTADRVVEPLRRLGGEVLHDTIGVKPFVAHQRIFDASVPSGLGYYWKSHYLADLGDEAIDLLVEHNRHAPRPWSYTIVFQLGGAIRDVADDATAYPARDAGFAVNVNGVAEDPADDDEITAWARRLFDALTPHATGGVYVNFVGNEGEERVRAAFGASYERLARVKARWDPDNIFRANQNIMPAVFDGNRRVGA
jgi:FAD/FMN-containing dehydrogenase